MNSTFLTTALSIILAVQATGVAEENKPTRRVPHVVFVTGDHEYQSEITMPMIAGILEAKHGMKCTVLYAVNPETRQCDPKYEKNIEGLEAIKTADLMVLYLRWRILPDDQLRMILDYIDSGRPVVGLRTSTHSFLYPAKSPNAKWNDGFGEQVLGQKWITHHGHDASTMVHIALKDHPITRGVELKFHCRSWLYNVMPLHGDCTALALGTALKGDRPDDPVFGTPNPVAWTKSYRKSRVFYTSLGHPDDFEKEAMRRLLVNGIYWALGLENRIPATGTNVDLPSKSPSSKAAPSNIAAPVP